MEKLIQQLRELLNSCALKEAELNRLISEAQSEQKSLAEYRSNLDAQKTVIDSKVKAAEEVLSKADQTLTLDERESALASDKSVFALYKQNAEKELTDKKLEVTELLNKLEIKRRKITEIVQDEAVKRRLEAEKIEW